jgi:hypothetical protein|tara:strand:- start:1279 stop:2082 length:804 start_codon:yes stop_codon:yes gene_type:complete
MGISIDEKLSLKSIVNFDRYPIDRPEFADNCKKSIDSNGCIVLPNFLIKEVIDELIKESLENQHKAFYCEQQHNVYITPKDNNFESDHPYNHQVISSKGCITDDEVPDNSKLRKLYDSQLFRNFIAQTVNKKQLYEYADNLSSINIHYAAQSQELGWHFDNSSFAVTLLIQKSQKGGEFQYVRNFRDADNNDMNFSGVKKLLRGEINSESLSMEPGTLVLFRGKNSIHRVTPVEGDLTRILAVLAYNSEPNISLSETSRMTFYGRLN